MSTRFLDHGLVIAASGALSVLAVVILAQSLDATASPAGWLGSAFSVGALALALGLAAAWHHARQRDHALDELAVANAALARSNRDLDQFAYVASHDLKAPLRGIANVATWIEDDLGDRADDQVRGHLRLLRGRAERMEALIEGILAYARADRGRGDITVVDVRALVAEVQELLPVPTGARIDVVGELPTLRTYRAPLQQVWMNLLGNALKHGRPDGRIELGGRREGAAWRFWVKDDGPGIAPEYHERVFQIFQTLAPRDQVEGAGIGLAVVRKLVEAHGGRVWLTSAVGTGATVTFTWGEPT